RWFAARPTRWSGSPSGVGSPADGLATPSRQGFGIQGGGPFNEPGRGLFDEPGPQPVCGERQLDREDDDMSHANEDTLRTVYAAFAKGDVATVMGLPTDDIKYHISGRSLVSGDYSGKDEVLGFFGKLMQLSGGTFQLEVLDILANDEHGVTSTRERGQRE